MTSELQAFIDYFKDEEELRSAIEGLLSKREGCSGIRNLHGKDEVGKDLIFSAPAGLGRLTLNACVVKLAKITGSASDAKSGARNVLIQCDQALDTPVLNTQGHEDWVSQVYVMCPNELSATAMQSVLGRFKGKPSQIEFICGHDLFQLFKDLWPGFIFFQPDLLSAHLDTLGKELESDKNIHRLASVHGLSAITKKANIYVEPLLSHPRGSLSRGSIPIDRAFFLHMAQISDAEKIQIQIERLVSSLQIVDYLPKVYQTRRSNCIKHLRSWPARFYKEWTEAFVKARNDAHARGEPTPRSIPIPRKVVDTFLCSPEYKFATDAYDELGREITDANSIFTKSLDHVALLDSLNFAGFGSLLHATSDCYPTIRFSGSGQLEWNPGELLASDRNLLITAAPGFGKTSFCRNHFLADLERFKSLKSRVLPLYFAAHTIAIGTGKAFEDLFIRPEVSSRLKNDQSLKVRIYLDGLDEIRSTELRDRILDTTKEACSPQNSRYHCVATARDHVGGYSTSWLSRVNLSPLSEASLRELVTAWLDYNSELISLFYSELRDSESLIPVLGVPLLATLTILVFKNLHRLPENKLRLYQMFIDLLLGGWNLAKGLQRASRYSSTAKLLTLTRLAGMMHARKRKECESPQISTVLKQVAPSLLSEKQSLVAELIEDGLLLPTGRSSYTFPHLSFQEYLAAKDAIDPAREEERRVVTLFLSGDDWYKEVATFLVSMTTNPLRMRNWIVDLAGPLATTNGISDGDKRAAYLIAKINDMFPECKKDYASI